MLLPDDLSVATSVHPSQSDTSLILPGGAVQFMYPRLVFPMTLVACAYLLDDL